MSPSLSGTHKESLQDKILQRTWETLENKDFDREVLRQLKSLAASAEMSHTAKLVTILSSFDRAQ